MELRRIVKIADWDQAIERTIEFSEHSYTPNTLEFERGKPYVLRLKNKGQVSHDLLGSGFFDAVAVKSVITASGYIVVPSLHELYLRPRQEMTVSFVPMEAGEFLFFCSIPGHQENGMEGVLKIR